MQKLFRCLVGVMAGATLLLSAIANAGDATAERAALFEAPSTSSRQLRILDTATPVEVIGKEIVADGMVWLPIKAGGESGYVRKTNLKLEDDPAPSSAKAADSEPEQSGPTIRMRLWVSDGLAFINSSYSPLSAPSTTVRNGYTGNRLVIGYDFNLGRELQWILGVSYAFLISDESTPDVGGIHRSSTLASVGFYFIPHLLYFKLNGGFQTISSSLTTSSSSGGLNLAWTGGATLGLRLPVAGRLNVGVEGVFDAVQAVNSTPLFGSVLGTASFPSQNLFSVAAVVGLDLGRVR